MCVDQNAVHLDTVFEPVNVATPSQQLPFEYHEMLPVNVRSSIRPGNTIQFKFPREGLLIPNSLSFFFNLAIDWLPAASASRNMNLCPEIRNVFSRVRLLLGRTVILEDIQEYGMMCRVTEMYEKSSMRYTTTDGYLSGNGTKFNVLGLTDSGVKRDGYHSIAQTNSTRPGQIPRRYKTDVKLGMFEQNKPIPLMFMNEELTLEFTTVSSANSFAFTFSSAYSFGDSITSYQIGRPVLRYRVYYPTLQLKNQIFNRMAQDMYILQWGTYQYHRFPLPITQRLHILNVPCRFKRLKYALATIRCEDDFIDIGQDTTFQYVALDPRIVDQDCTAVRDNARRTMLKQYQWFYNNTAIPRLPVPVAGSEKVYTLTGTQTTNPVPTNSTWDVDLHSTTTGAEAYYYLRETLGLTDNQTGPITGDMTFLSHDNYNNGNNAIQFQTVTTKFSETLTPNERRTAPCGLVIAGKFSDKIVLPDGKIEETALDCQVPNAKLQLQLEFNAASGPGSAFIGKNFSVDGSSNPIPGTGVFPNMFLDVWLRYDTVVQINHKGEVEVIQ